MMPEDNLNLEEMSEYEGTEVGEVWALLARLARYESYLSDEFVELLRAEIAAAKKDIRENYKLVQREVTYTRNIRRLELKET